MEKIVLLCAAGMSTSMLVKKMEEAAKGQNYECEIDAFPIAEAASKAVDADVILLGPQVRYELNSVKNKFPNKPVESIDMVAYGMMDGKKVIEQVKRMIEE